MDKGTINTLTNIKLLLLKIKTDTHFCQAGEDQANLNKQDSLFIQPINISTLYIKFNIHN